MDIPIVIMSCVGYVDFHREVLVFLLNKYKTSNSEKILNIINRSGR